MTVELTVRFRVNDTDPTHDDHLDEIIVELGAIEPDTDLTGIVQAVIAIKNDLGVRFAAFDITEAANSPREHQLLADRLAKAFSEFASVSKEDTAMDR